MTEQKKEPKDGLAVYRAIAAVQGELAKHGISKDRNNTQQGYSFRGIDDVYNALAPLLAKHQLCILPRILSRELRERVTIKTFNNEKKESVLFYTVLEVEYDFIAAEDGSKHTVKVYGEAMDSGDKSTNKSMSAAYKYACLQVFSIPTEGDNDADGTTHEIIPPAPVVPTFAASDYMPIQEAIEKSNDPTATWTAYGAEINYAKQHYPGIYSALSEAGRKRKEEIAKSQSPTVDSVVAGRTAA